MRCAHVFLAIATSMASNSLVAQVANGSSITPPVVDLKPVSTSSGTPPITDLRPAENCSSAYLDSDSISMFKCSTSTTLVIPECASCWETNGSGVGTIDTAIPTTRPVSMETIGLPLCPGATGSITSNSCTPGAISAIPLPLLR